MNSINKFFMSLVFASIVMIPDLVFAEGIRIKPSDLILNLEMYDQKTETVVPGNYRVSLEATNDSACTAEEIAMQGSCSHGMTYRVKLQALQQGASVQSLEIYGFGSAEFNRFAEGLSFEAKGIGLSVERLSEEILANLSSIPGKYITSFALVAAEAKYSHDIGSIANIPVRLLATASATIAIPRTKAGVAAGFQFGRTSLIYSQNQDQSDWYRLKYTQKDKVLNLAYNASDRILLSVSRLQRNIEYSEYREFQQDGTSTIIAPYIQPSQSIKRTSVNLLYRF